MRAKNKPISLKPNSKTRIYLRNLGFIDGKTGRKNSKTRMNMSEFLNHCIIRTCEQVKHPMNHIATSDELIRAWKKYQISERYKEIAKLESQILEIGKETMLTSKAEILELRKCAENV